MQVVFYVERSDKLKAEEIVRKDPVGRQSLTIRDAASIGDDRDGAFIYIDGTEEACELAEEWLDDIAERLDDDEAREVIEAFEEQEASVMEGVGGIFD